MRRVFLLLATLTLALWAGPALAGSSSDNSQSSSAGGGSSSSGSNTSSASIHTSGGGAVGVAQGSVSGGSRASGSNGGGGQEGSAASGPSVGGQVAGVAGAPANAVEDGVVSQVNLPALDLGETQSTADRRPDVLTWAIAGAIVIGLVVLYRRLPRSTPA